MNKLPTKIEHSISYLKEMSLEMLMKLDTFLYLQDRIRVMKNLGILNRSK